MRRLVLTLAAALLVAPALASPAPLAAAPAADSAAALPGEAAIGGLMAPMSLGNFQMTPANQDGWHVGEKFQLTGGSGGGPPVPVQVGLYATELPTEEAAAGFIQVQLGNYRNAVNMVGLNGNLAPASDLNLDADEVYLGQFESKPSETTPLLAIVLIARYGTLVTAVDSSMMWDKPGTVSDQDRQGLGAVTGGLAALIEKQIP